MFSAYFGFLDASLLDSMSRRYFRRPRKIHGPKTRIPLTVRANYATPTNGNAVAFTVMVTTSGSAAAPPFSFTPRVMPFSALRAVPALAAGILLLLLLALAANRELGQCPRRLAFGGAFATIAVFLVLATAGCGGGSTTVAAPPPPQAVRPQGSSTIVITPSAMSASAKPLQLQPIQLTLTVK